MPELPEVEIARRALLAWTSGRRIVRVEVTDPAVLRSRLSSRTSDAVPGATRWLVDHFTDARTVAVLRHGKRLGWRLEGVAGPVGLLVHLGMTGKWVRRAEGVTPRSGRLALHLDDESAVWFTDSRRFGCLAAVLLVELTDRLREGLGPDALDTPLDGSELARRLGDTRPIKVALLDQAALAGLGNIQATEALWRAGLHPARRGQTLTPAQWERLARAIPAQLQHTIDAEAAGEIVYLGEAGAKNPFEIYGRAGEPCPRCATPLARFQQSGRGSFFCPRCQPT